MKAPVSILLFLGCLFAYSGISAQNVSLNVLTQNSGFVNQGGSVFVEITLANTSSTVTVPLNKVRPQISVPTSIVSIPATGHVLPAGWSIISNAGGVIRLCNGSDAIPPNTARTALIAIQGNVLGGPLTISGNTTFANGTVCSTSGAATSGDVAGDNTSTSTIQVYDPVPLTLTSFYVKEINCKPFLNWVTENEINFERYEIEKRNATDNNWTYVTTITAKGTGSSKNTYTYSDRSNTTSTETILYRLKMIDRNGDFRYSEIVSVNMKCQMIAVDVFPNPVQDQHLHITLRGSNEIIYGTLWTLSGQSLIRTVIGNGDNKIDITSLASGTYILSLKGSKGFEKEVKIFIKH